MSIRKASCDNVLKIIQNQSVQCDSMNHRFHLLIVWPAHRFNFKSNSKPVFNLQTCSNPVNWVINMGWILQSFSVNKRSSKKQCVKLVRFLTSYGPSALRLKRFLGKCITLFQSECNDITGRINIMLNTLNQSHANQSAPTADKWRIL